MIFFIAALGALSACQSADLDSAKQTPMTEILGRATLPTQTQTDASQSEIRDQGAMRPLDKPEISYGSGFFFRSAPLENPDSASNQGSESGVSFAFRDAPIDAVINEVLGEAFGQNYSVDPSISETITLRLGDVRSLEQAISGLNAALNLRQLEVKLHGNTYVVQRRANDGQSVPAPPTYVLDSAQLPEGATTAVLQLQYARAEEAVEIASAMLPDGLIRYTQDDSGMVAISGDPGNVSTAVQILKSLDVNWLNAVSTALIPIENATPDEIAADLQPVASRLGGTSILPMERLQSVLIISRNAEILNQATTWISRLDREAKPTLARDLLVYEARYVNAEDLLHLAGAGSAFTENSNLAPSSQSVSGRQPIEAISSSPKIENEGSSYSSPFINESDRDGLYRDLSIRVDQGQNAIVARGPSNELRSLSELFATLDKPKRQVQIKATIVEVTLRDSNSFGVQWDAVEDAVAATFTTSESGAVTSLFPGVSVSYINTDVSTVVNALATTSDVEIVSAPQMLVLNNETARLQIGDQVPIITQSAVSISDPGAPVVNSTVYRDTGVILTVTPRIRAGGMVEVAVTQEVSNVSETTSSDIDSPTISQRRIESVLAVPDGATAVLGGLMNSTRSESETGIPFLKDAPILGAAFRSKTQTERRTELIILIEPTVVLSIDPMVNLPVLLRNALVEARGGALP